MVEEITKAIEKEECLAGIYIELEKAFDTVDHGIFLRKLEMDAIRSVAYCWLKSYLKNSNMCTNLQ